MKTILLPFWVLAFFISLHHSLSNPFNGAEMISVPAQAVDAFSAPSYTRFPEVEKACKSILSSAVDINFHANMISSLTSELSFMKGDWEQDSGDSPLMPFDGTVVPAMLDPVSLAGFTLAHVDPVGRYRNAVNVSGALVVGISWQETIPDMNRMFSPGFQVWPGFSELTILFEGVYAETDRERVLCLLGSSKLPFRQSGSSDPWEWVKDSGLNGKFPPPVVEDDQILLVLRYPKTLTLTSRAVLGEMKSLNIVSSIKYFDKVRFLSQLGYYSKYQYGSEGLVSKACKPYPYHDDNLDHQIEIYKGSAFCQILDRYVSGVMLTVVPNWKCNSTDEYCSKLGPFASGKQMKVTDGGFGHVGLMMQDIRCEPKIEINNTSFARVSSVFRVVPRWEYQYLSYERTGLNNMTLSAEGVWNSSAGQLCMVGCLGPSGEECNSRICLYVSTSFSITQRNVIFGQIVEIDNGKATRYFPLSFEKPVRPFELRNSFSTASVTSYKYSKFKMAVAFLEKNEHFVLGKLVTRSHLSYPKLEESYDEKLSLSRLSHDLRLRTPAVPDPLPKIRIERPFLQLEIFSLGSLVRRYWVYSNFSTPNGMVPRNVKSKSTVKELLLNVSAEITLSGSSYTNFSTLFLEGLYNPFNGKMYLIGCRDVRASWRLLSESMDLENGLDCLIEVKIEYPPTTARWLMNPTAKVSIASQRTEDDPLHFSSIKLQTLPIMYRGQREDILSRRCIEGILRILTLSVATACIMSQLFYIRDNISSVPYISVVMLGVQALGYSIPLITGAEALFTKRSAASRVMKSYELQNQWFQSIGYVVKILVLGVFLLTLRLAQKIVKSRIRLRSRAPLEARRVPNDKWVLFISFILHAVGFLIILGVHYVEASKRTARVDAYMDSRGNIHKLHEWGVELEEYIGLIQDFFLLPQIIGNILWQINCRPLRKAYYVGITIVRLLPHVYDYINSPVFNPYFSEEYEFVNPSLDFYSRFGDVAIPVTAVVLAAIIYIQQKLSYQKLSQACMPLGSSVYERLPSKSVEAELVSGVNESSTHGGSQKNESSTQCD